MPVEVVLIDSRIAVSSAIVGHSNFIYPYVALYRLLFINI
jgi:hypothetical protein